MIQVVSFPMVVLSVQESAAESYTFHARVAILAFITTMAFGQECFLAKTQPQGKK